ncbi:uncharacterized protein BXZ73DRAFT_92573 [Epithele typhae]|uniref:uncharacterized protein n=1 Tax=Epithele typhae TaxID=378194 RepID=UPI002007CE3E|nr:uncharacterized protein BXZ73DRAFT_92573 [Epithele typhae]KAH9915794.1 hypothetical protein BXZ73DRAFT_92573 [Epithele typhae]
MRMYLMPNNPERTTLVSVNGNVHYKVTTSRAHCLAPRVLHIRRPTDCEREGYVAEVVWRRLGGHPVVRSNMFDGRPLELGLREFLYQTNSSNMARNFLGNDGQEYRWKLHQGGGLALIHCSSKCEVARYTFDRVREGVFKKEDKWCLWIGPTTLDIDMVVFTFLIMEKWRRDRLAAENPKGKIAEEVSEGGCESGGS